MERIDTNVAFGLTRLDEIAVPFAVIPEVCCVFPSRNASPPETTCCRSGFTPRGEPLFGLRIRSHDRWNAAAVRGEPSENLRPGRIWNVYVSPSFETLGNAVAACG